MENRKSQIIAVLFTFLLIIATVPIVGTQSNLVLGGPLGAELTGVIFDDQGVDTDGDDLFNYLKLSIEINVTKAGIYRIEVSDLIDNSTGYYRYINVYNSESMFLDTGLGVINVSLHGPTIYASGLNPVRISHIRLYDSYWNWLQDLEDIPLSHEYLYTLFDPPGASLIDVVRDDGVDTDDDDLFDFLEVSVQVNVTDAGMYRVSLSELRDVYYNYISVYASASEYLEPGIWTVNVSLNGRMIYASSLNPRYVAYVTLEDDESHKLDSLEDVQLSGEYFYYEFEGPGAVLTGKITDGGVDTDGDKKYNYLQIGVEINVTEAGYYEVEISGLEDSSWNYIDVWGYESNYFDVGVHVIDISLFGTAIYFSKLNPRYVSSIRLYGYGYYYSYSYLDDVPLSDEYLYTEFDPPGAFLTGNISDEGVDTDGDEKYDYLQIGVEINVTEPGTYSVDISTLLNSSYEKLEAYYSASEYLDKGIQTIYLYVDGVKIHVAEFNPMYIENIRLGDEKYHYLDDLALVSLSKEYFYYEFDGPGAVLTGNISDGGVDTDGDYKFDYLQIGVEVNVTNPNWYGVAVGGLADSSYEHIEMYDSVYTFLDAGVQIVYLHLSGPRIYISHLNPKYVERIELWSEYRGTIDDRKLVPLSREYYYTEFDPPAAWLTGRVFDEGVDTDGDGDFNYLKIGLEINVTKAGVYSGGVDGLGDVYGDYISIWDYNSSYFDVGLGVLNISLYGPRIYTNHKNPRYINHIYLSAPDYNSYLDYVPLHREYYYTEFDVPAILTGKIFDEGVDTDGDGKYEYLQIGVQVNVSDPGIYLLQVYSLSDAQHNYVSVWDSKTANLSKGIQTVNLYLYGPQIYVSRCNPTIADYIYLSDNRPYPYTYYEILQEVPLSREYSYTEFEAPFIDVETKFVVYPDGRVAVEGALNYTNMVPENKALTAEGFFNLTGNEASAGLTVTLPLETANQYPPESALAYMLANSTIVHMLAKYQNGLLDLGINSTTILPSIAKSIYPFNTTDGTLNATYSEGILNIEAEGNTTLPNLAAQQFPFNATDISVVGTYSQNTLDGRVTFSVLDGFTFDDVNVDFTGNKTDLTFNGTLFVVFNMPLGDFVIRNETELIQIIDQLKNQLPEMVSNMTGGLLNVTELDIAYVPNSLGARVTFRVNINGDFVRALAYVISGGRNEMLVCPVLNEAYQSVQSGSFDIQYSYTTLGASAKLSFSYDLKRLMDYIQTPLEGTIPYVMTSYSMQPTLWIGDLVFVEEVANASDIIADPETGDIIAFYHPQYSRYIFIHRAINKTYANGTLYFTTKGDANPNPDEWSVPANLVIGKVVSRVPLYGYLLSDQPLYYYYYPQNTTAARLSLEKAMYSSLQNMSIQLSYSSADRQFDSKLTLVDELKALVDECTILIPQIFPPETPPELRSFVEAFLNTTYASVDSADISFMYESGKAELEATATMDGDLSAEVNYIKNLYFQLVGAQYSYYNWTIPWQLDFINQTKLDISNFRISAKLGKTSFEGRIEGLTLMPPIDPIDATHFKLEQLFNLTTPQYPGQPEFPGRDQKLKITIEGGSNATHGVTVYRNPQTVPEPDATTPHTMIWNNQSLTGLKDLVFNICELNQYDLGWIVGRVVEAESLSPMVGASITTDGLTATTDANGYYVIADVPPDDYTVTASAAGYLSDSKLVHLDSGVTTSVDFTLILIVPTGTLSITTTPLAGEVFVNGTSWGTDPGSRVVPVGTYNVSFGPVAGYYTPTWQLVTVEEDAVTVVTASYEPIMGTLTVTTTPVSGEVFVNGFSWGTAPQSRVVQVGTYTVSFGPVEGYYTPPDRFASVYENQSTVIEGVYEEISPPGAIHGTVTDASTGLPIVGATVTADNVSVTTDAEGYYNIELMPGTYTVVASMTGYFDSAALSVEVTPGETTTLNFTITPITETGTISGTVTDASTGHPIAGATVSVDTTYSASTDSTGVYTINDVSPGDYTVKVSASGYVDKSKTATVTADETTIVNFALAVPGVAVEEVTKPELVSATNPFVVNANEEAATSLIISKISAPVKIVVQKVTAPVGVDPPPGTWKVLGNYVQITVNNTDITVNATIRIYYTHEQLEASELDETTLQIHFWNATSGEWEAVESHVNTEEHYVWAIISHFSLFAILGQPSEAPAPLPTQLWFLAIVGATVAVIAIVAVFIVVRKRKSPHSAPKSAQT